jgi:hypothetical protein
MIVGATRPYADGQPLGLQLFGDGVLEGGQPLGKQAIVKL